MPESDEERKMLAGFHQTISEQLNSRPSESRQFFGLLIVVSTGYEFVLSNPGLVNSSIKLGDEQEETDTAILTISALLQHTYGSIVVSFTT